MKRLRREERHITRRYDEIDGSTLPTASTPKSPYVCYPRQYPKISLRLVEVLPASSGGLVQIKMKNVVITAANTYRCLSYMWGAPGEEIDILVDGCSMRFRRNLFEFLKEAPKIGDWLRKDPLWIDAICINQSDDEEKSFQVQRMGQIYRQAKEVVIWLGKDPDLDLAFDYAKACYDFERLDYGFEKVQLSVIKFHDHDYWRRAWVAQETILAHEIRVMSESKALPWRWLLYSHDEVLASLRKNSMRDFHAQRDAGNLDIWRLLEWHALSDCHDVRDRIYSLLSLVQASPFGVDYRESIYDLFYKVVDYFTTRLNKYHISILLACLGITPAELEREIS